jgi:hypothetical protein
VIVNRMVVQKDFQTLLQAYTSDLTTSSFSKMETSAWSDLLAWGPYRNWSLITKKSQIKSQIFKSWQENRSFDNLQ